MFANKYPAVILGPQNTVNNFFQILWNSRCDILVTFPSHLKKLRSILILTRKVELWIFPLVSLVKKQLFQSKFQCRKYRIITRRSRVIIKL